MLRSIITLTVLLMLSIGVALSDHFLICLAILYSLSVLIHCYEILMNREKLGNKFMIFAFIMAPITPLIFAIIMVRDIFILSLYLLRILFSIEDPENRDKFLFILKITILMATTGISYMMVLDLI